MQDWQEAMWIAISLMFGVAVIVLMTNFMYMGKEVNAKLAQVEASNQLMAEYRQYVAYENREVMPQDVVTMIMKLRGQPFVYVDPVDGVPMAWCDSNLLRGRYSLPTNTCSYDTEAVSAIIPKDQVYRSRIIRGDSGEILGIKFTGEEP